MYQVYSIVRCGFIIVKRGRVSSIKNYGSRNYWSAKT